MSSEGGFLIFDEIMHLDGTWNSDICPGSLVLYGKDRGLITRRAGYPDVVRSSALIVNVSLPDDAEQDVTSILFVTHTDGTYVCVKINKNTKTYLTSTFKNHPFFSSKCAIENQP